MAFGQPSGPPAGQRQMQRLNDLLGELGFDSFREARHQLGLNQRQANGRFSVDEADELIERLDAGVQVKESFGGPTDADLELLEGSGATAAFKDRMAERQRQTHARSLLNIPDEALADELSRRGWCCIPPGD